MEAAINEAWERIRSLPDVRVIGLGSGRTIIPFIHGIVNYPEFHTCTFIPTSFQASELLDQLRLRRGDLNAYMRVDVTVDGCDAYIIDDCIENNVTLIKGGGGCMLQEKMVAQVSGTFIIIASREKARKTTDGLVIPVEVHPFAVGACIERIKQHSGVKSVTVRQGTGKVGPVISDSGNVIIDVLLTEDKQPVDLNELNEFLLSISGVLETGLFIGMHPCLLTF